eukprot:CAMPEP_0184867268 /NCGR_PEP_ID=MMETSP0580-20130426/25749_1 /TAXON_ID=1118495 /ORGANISM="Dactyliosolen fragilissimus" /LENGTH=51 /DNA_ID=CAMNT_0027367445 /DNA_START=31 /DNA_END=186 /DNA_ORIENTATION=+
MANYISEAFDSLPTILKLFLVLVMSVPGISIGIWLNYLKKEMASGNKKKLE